MKRKVWSKPKLVVLVRGKPEEGILGFCKAFVDLFGPGDTVIGCWGDPYACQVMSDS